MEGDLLRACLLFSAPDHLGPVEESRDVLVTERRFVGGTPCLISQSERRRSRSALLMTETDEMLIAALAIMGLRSSPKKG